ncbi:hypothetical protein [Arthrobacter sp. FW306-2-2C-D06B]|uniref:hypothetical protein n=1 Tax=Arthrobacter sp. FW306-2-2C-D06B TaxID=2879618 RepID=UPI001F27A245|nr:hypothetical protein [Arthrobacter sp. FW306-2-2C-D06B]UKA59779.1 hypothetical protein LFT47_05395 [Arthrobacter sp. FW306-2-2C-D06B]
MELKDWLTIGASLVVGLGSSGVTNWLNVRKAKADRLDAAVREQRIRRHDRNRTLREYLRVLEEVSADWEDTMMQRPSTIEGQYRDYIREARQSAYHLFHLFPDSEKWFLKNPFNYDGPGGLEQSEARPANEGAEEIDRVGGLNLSSYFSREVRGVFAVGEEG